MVSSGKFHLSLLIILSNAFPAFSCFNAIFSFGDSLADTGNALYSDPSLPSGESPYGETYIHKPTGRFCDGRLVVDFIAQAVGVPLLPPYLAGSNGQVDFRRGVNFAVGGATALGVNFFREKGLDVPWENNTLGTQINWFKQLLPSLCTSKSECDDILRNSLFLVGETGGNDYNIPFLKQRTLDEIHTYVPFVINAISSAINVLIELGALTLIVPGNFPIGCNFLYYQIYSSQRIEDYDPQTGCINWLNEFSEFHNHQLQYELGKLRRRHSHVTIIYADNYEVAMSIFRSPYQFGFVNDPVSTCCLASNSFNYNPLTISEKTAMIWCDDPSTYVCWDGSHMTEATYKIIADGFIKGPYAIPSVAGLCSDHTSHLLKYKDGNPHKNC